MKYCPACHKTYPSDYYVCPADQTGLQSAHELQPGMIIRNKYEILGRLGIGGMGVVYRGRHLTFNEVCAIKIVNDAIAGDANFLQRFQTEAVVTRKLRHPNAVRVDDFDYTDDGRPFIVMELVEGKNIGEILQSDGPFRVPRALRIATQAARALGVAHNLGVVHRDIKPANILLTKDEQGQEIAKVLDFGIAKLREVAGSDQPGMTMTGMVVGTPLYMSPEQFMGKKAAGEVDGRTDIYSLGVVLYQMVTAQLPFDGDTPYSLMMQHIQGTVRPPHELAPDLHIPEALSRVILKAIDKTREQRFQTAEEFIAAMDEVAASSEPWADAVVEESQTQDSPVVRPRTTVAIPAPTVRSTQPLSQPASSQPTSNQPTSNQPASNQTSRIQPSQGRASQVTPAPPKSGAKSEVSMAGKVTAPSASAVSIPATVAQPSAQPSLAGSVRAAPPADSVLVKSAAQHVFLQPKKFRLKQLVMLVVLLLAATLVAGVGYLKYQSFRRLRIETAVTEKLNAVPALRALRVSVSDKREVILDGGLSSADDRKAAEDLAGSVPDVTAVINRVLVTSAVVPGPGPSPAQVPAESYESLISDGMKLMDDGKYDEAIDCFNKAAAYPANQGSNGRAQELLKQAQQAQKTEEQLLKSRR
jgi:serine/threonine protein kinase